MRITFVESNAIVKGIYEGKRLYDGINMLNRENSSRVHDIGYCKADVVFEIKSTGQSHKMRYNIGDDIEVLPHLEKYKKTAQITEEHKELLGTIINSIKFGNKNYLYNFILDGELIHSYALYELSSEKELRTTCEILSGIKKGYGSPKTTPDRVDDITVQRTRIKRED